MKFYPTPLKDAYLIELERRADDRGFFARMFCQNEFAEAGLSPQFVQINNAFSTKKGTLRGLHYQLPPSAEIKLVRCVRGALFDCIIDIRPDSPTYEKWFGAELDDNNRLAMYVPRGFAHGILTLKTDTEVLYMVSDFYSPERERGLRWDDPHFNISWPFEPQEISPKDLAWPAFDAIFHGVDRLQAIR